MARPLSTEKLDMVTRAVEYYAALTMVQSIIAEDRVPDSLKEYFTDCDDEDAEHLDGKLETESKALVRRIAGIAELPELAVQEIVDMDLVHAWDQVRPKQVVSALQAARLAAGLPLMMGR